MVEDIYSQQLPCLYKLLCHFLIICRWVKISAWMVVRNNNRRRAVFYGFCKYLAWMNEALVERSLKDDGVVDESVCPIEC